MRSAQVHGFPFPSYRVGQRESLDAVRQAFDDGHRWVVVEAPTGSGKSAIGVTMAREARSAYLLTAQKVLQDQYHRDFGDLALLKGRANYDCLVAPTHAAAAPCLVGRTYPECEGCPYFRAKDRALASPRALMNYAYFLHEINYAGGFRERELLVLDEAHNLEAMLMGFVQVAISDAQLDRAGVDLRLPGFADELALFDFAEELRPRLRERVAQVDGGLGSGALPIDMELEQLRVRQWLDGQERRLAWLLDSRDDGVDWVVEHSRNDRGAFVGFKPVAVAPFAQELIFDHAERGLLLSATILDAPTFLRGLGLPADEVAVIQVPSTFDPERRPLRLRPVARLTRHHLDQDLPKLVAEVAEIMIDHETEKGVIHTHSYRIAQALRTGLPRELRRRLLSHDDASGREEALAKHMASPEPTVLLSPSMTEGLDLIDDLARWQVICKLPFPYLGDPQVSARRRTDPGWYEWRTCLSLVQAYGRAVRSEQDHAVTYLLDADGPAFLQRQSRRLPAWFVEAVREA